MRFHVVGTQEVLISHSGLVLAGALLQATQLKQRLDRVKLDGGGKPEISHGDNVLSMIGLLCMGKCDFEAINAFEAESDNFFRLALGLDRVPSVPRLDSGDDAVQNVRVLRQKYHRPVDWIIKRNLRKESLEEWFEEACTHGASVDCRLGKEVWIGDAWREWDGKVGRAVVEAIRRTTTADGQSLLVLEPQIYTFWTCLKSSQVTAQQVVELYHDHWTSEQFHSELKTDLDLERLPSGKFATNALVLECGLVAYDALRLGGQESLRQDQKLSSEQKMLVCKRVRHRRLRSAIQDMIYMACWLVRHSGRWLLALWKNNPWGPVWERVYERFLTGGRRDLIPAPLTG